MLLKYDKEVNEAIFITKSTYSLDAKLRRQLEYVIIVDFWLLRLWSFSYFSFACICIIYKSQALVQTFFLFKELTFVASHIIFRLQLLHFHPAIDLWKVIMIKQIKIKYAFLWFPFMTELPKWCMLWHGSLELIARKIIQLLP